MPLGVATKFSQQFPPYDPWFAGGFAGGPGRPVGGPDRDHVRPVLGRLSAAQGRAARLMRRNA